MGRLFFGDLWMAWFLAPVFVLWVALWFLAPRIRAQFLGPPDASLRFSTLEHVKQLRRSPTLLMRRLVQGLRLLSVALLLVAMLRPQTGRTLTEINTQGIDIALVVDTSGSMEALDLDSEQRAISRRRNRLEVAKEVVEKFVENRESDQMGLVVFGSNAFTQCPLTLDHGILATFLDRLEIGMAGDGTAIGSAIGVAVKRLRESPAASKVIVLLTDGLNNAGSISPLTAAEIAKTYGIKVYTVAAGTREKAPFLVQTPLGPEVIYENVEIDEDTLRQIAEMTDGAYFRAEDEAALRGIYEEIDELERTEIVTESYMEYDEQYRWFVLPATALLLLEFLLLATRLRKLP